jgi:hypothetical protein
MRRSRFIVVALLVAVPAFLFAPMAPFGHLIWPEPAMQLDPPPTSTQAALFMLLGLITSVAFGIAVSFLFFGLPAVRRLAGSRPTLGAAMHAATFWFLGNWWLHDSLHMILGVSPGRLLVLEYGFHVTLMIAGATIAYGLVTLGTERSEQLPLTGASQRAFTT